MAISMGSAIAYLEMDTSNFQKGIKSALSDLKVFQSESATTEQKLKGLSSAFATVGSGLTKAVTLPLSAIGTASVKVASDFEANMSQVAATMGITTDSIKAGNKEFEALKNTAKEMGSTTKYTASEAAQGLNILAMAGLSAEESIQAIPTVLDLASAGAMSLDQAASYVTATVKGFADSMDNANYYADLMAKGATLANTDVNMLGVALSSASSSARGYGQDAESTALSLLRLAEQNITGTEAATALNRAMMDLYTPTEAAKKALDELGIATYDSSGNARDFNDIVDELNSALSDMSDEEANAYKNTIFTTYGMQAFNKMTTSTTEKVNYFKDGLANATGSTAQQAQTQLDNLQGSMTLLGSALEGAGIAIGERLAPHIRDMADRINQLVTWFNNLSDAQIDMIVTIGKVVAAIGPMLLIGSKLINTAILVGKAIKTTVNTMNDFKTGISLVKAGYSGLATQMGGIPALVANIAGLFGKLAGIFTTIGTFITGTLIPAITTLVSTIGAPVIIITAIIAAIVLLYNKCEWFRNGVNSIIKSVIGFFENFVEYVKGIPELISGFVEDIKQKFSELKESAEEKVSGMINNIVQFFTDLPSNIKQKIDETIESIIQWGEELKQNMSNAVSEAIDSVIQFFSDLPYKLGYALGYALGTVAKWGIELGQWITENVPIIINNIVTFFEELPGKIWTWLTNTYEKVKQWGEDTIEKAKEIGQKFIDNIVTFFKELPGNVETFITNAYNNVKTWATNMVAKAKETAQKFVQNVVTFFKELPGNIKTFVTNAYNNVKTWATNMIAKAKETAQNFVTNVITFIKELPGKIKTYLTNAYNNVVKWATDTVAKAKKAATDIYNGIVDKIKEIPGKMLSIGKDIVTGIWNGISGAKDWIKEKVGSFAQGILDGMKAALGIHSPSTKFRDTVGKNIVAGIVEGVKDDKDEITKELEDATDVDANVKTNTNLKDLMELYENIFKTISDNMNESLMSFAETLKETLLNVLFGLDELIDDTRYIRYGTQNGVPYSTIVSGEEKALTEQGQTSYNTSGGDTFIFQSTVQTPYEYARQLKKTKQEILNGFA